MSDISASPPVFPAPFLERMKRQLGGEAFDLFIAALQESPSVSVRLNKRKRSTLPAFQTGKAVPWCHEGILLEERPAFAHDPLWHAGAYYVQESSSMFLSFVVQQLTHHKPLRVLDLCAAPGGKTTLLADALPENALIVANEYVRSRAAILKENVIKWGRHNMAVTTGSAEAFAKATALFDLILVDAPCSGEGMFRKDSGAVTEWSEENLRICEERQRQILTAAIAALKPGGYLIYSTCTFNPGENEENLQWLIDDNGMLPVSISHPFSAIANGDSPYPCYRFLPHRTPGEGFFLSVVQKSGEDWTSEPILKKRNSPIPSPLQALTESHPDCSLYQAGETYGLIPTIHTPFLQQLEKVTGMLYKGVELGEIKKNTLLPAHALAMWSDLSDNFLRQELSLEDALRYLRREPLCFEAPASEWILVSFASIPLGWVKAVGNRLNNYYPMNWRLLS